MTSPIGEDDLAAWIDGRLSPERQRLVDAHRHAPVKVHAVGARHQFRELHHARRERQQRRGVDAHEAREDGQVGVAPASELLAQITGEHDGVCERVRRRQLGEGGGGVARECADRAVYGARP